MTLIEITMRDGATAFVPGEVMEGTISWQLDRPPQSVELRLFWYTRGKGSQDLDVVATATFPGPALQDRREFSFTLPDGPPYSFSGKLISLIWALEVVVEPGKKTWRWEIIVSPSRREILLQSPPSWSRDIALR